MSRYASTDNILLVLQYQITIKFENKAKNGNFKQL